MRRKIFIKILTVIFFFSSIAMTTYFIAKTILVRRRKTGKNRRHPVRTSRNFSPTDFIPADVLPFSLDRDMKRAKESVREETRIIDAKMSTDLKIQRAIKRLEIGLDELTVVAPESFPNPEVSARILQGIFNFMKTKIRFFSWLEIVRICKERSELERIFQESFEYIVHSLPKEIEENVNAFDNFEMTDRLFGLIESVTATPTFDGLANNRIFYFQLLDVNAITAPPNMLRRQDSLKRFLQVAYHLSRLGTVCLFADIGKSYLEELLELDTKRALALLRFDFDIWGRMTASRKALEISQRKDVDFSRFGLISETEKASVLVKSKTEL